MKNIGFKLCLGMLIAFSIFAVFMTVHEAKLSRDRERRFCTRWLQLATSAESLKVYKLRPTCLYLKEDQ